MQKESGQKDEDWLMELIFDIMNALGLDDAEKPKIEELVKVYNAHVVKNEEKRRYYEGRVTLGEVNLGLALPNGISKLEIGCSWGEKAVDVLASRSMFDGFVSKSGTDADQMNEIINANQFISEYAKACRDELKYGCTFATLSADPKAGCRIRFHSPETAAGLWNGVKGRIDCGLAIVDTVPDETRRTWIPSVVNYYTDDAVWVIQRYEKSDWRTEKHPHRMGRPLMEPLIWNATSKKPFGRSRLKYPVRNLIKSYVRTVANATIGLEFSTAPQKYLLGVTDEQYDQIISQKFIQYVGSILASTTNPDTGEKPTFGQLSQGSIEPHVQMLRVLATQFSAATGLSVTDTGVVNDANPTSSEAIIAQTQSLILMAEQLNAGNADALYTIAQMAMAIADNTTMDQLTDDQKQIVAHFRNPSMPSVAVTADAAIKIASARPEFAGTDTFLEMIGFDQADIRRIKAQETRARGLQTLSEEFGNDLEG